MPHHRSVVVGLAVLLSCSAQAFVQDDAVALLQQAPGSLQPDAPPPPPPPAASAAAAVPAAAAATAAPAAAAEAKVASPPAAGAMLAQQKSRWNATRREAPREEKFAVGEKVKMRVEQGELAGTLVPGVIKQIRGNGRYRVRLLSVPVTRDIFNVPGKYLVKTEEDRFPEAIQLFREKSEVAVKAVEQLGKEANARLRSEAISKKMNATEISKWVSSQHLVAQREVEREARALGCPTGFSLFVGAIKGVDRLWNSTVLADTAELCGQECGRKAACNAFQWSPNRKFCILDKASSPGAKTRPKDFLYCGRGNSTQANLGNSTQAKL